MSEVQVMKRVVTRIPQRVQPLTRMPLNVSRKRRVAGYARVSTDSDEQENSYEAQVDYFTEYILGRDDWTFVKIYTDEGITGTSTKHREGFNEMITDALAGKIDLIVTKSVSRFARNTVDSLTVIRELKANGVEVYFEKENIYTFDSKGELMLTIMSSLAQEESRSISENVTWGIRKGFADGKLLMPYSSFLGYRKGDDGRPEIVPQEAETVRSVFRRFLEGMTPHQIAALLTRTGIPTPRGRAKWSDSTVMSILSNERYKGDAVLQKSFCTDFLTKRFKKNEGEVPQYYVSNSHPAIVSEELFDLVQQEIEARREMGKQYSGKGLFASRIVCGSCGGFYGSKVWHSTDRYRKVIWRCNSKYSGGSNAGKHCPSPHVTEEEIKEGCGTGSNSAKRCTTPHVTENEIKDGFVRLMQGLLAGKDRILDECREVINAIKASDETDRRISALRGEIPELERKMRELNDENARSPLRQDSFRDQYELLCSRYDELSREIEEAQKEKNGRAFRIKRITLFMKMLSEQKECPSFDPAVFISSVEKVIVSGKKGSVLLTFVLRDGSEHPVPVNREPRHVASR